ncbi:hypothetical protein KIPB_012706, partial [Kipferlia bialata]
EGEYQRILVFAKTKIKVSDVSDHLAAQGMAADCIHGNKTQFQRQKALDNFHSGKTLVLVATDVVARGIDVPHIDLVVNYDLPAVPEDYVHRIGRTGRAGREGEAISFMSTQFYELSRIEKFVGFRLEKEDLPDFDYMPRMSERQEEDLPDFDYMPRMSERYV